MIPLFFSFSTIIVFINTCELYDAIHFKPNAWRDLGSLNVENLKISNFKFFVVGELSKLLRGPKAAPKQFSPLSEAGMASLDPNAVALPQRRKRKRKNNNSLKGYAPQPV